jgi:cell filamentation protein
LPTDPYVYPGTDCLRNRFGIRDARMLARIEAEQTSILIAQLERIPLVGRYDLEHLKAFHRRIFGDIYE